jgi:hypothetical protein
MSCPYLLQLVCNKNNFAQELKHMLVHFPLFFMKLRGFAIIHLQSSDNIILKDKVQQSLMELEGMMELIMTITIFFKL